MIYDLAFDPIKIQTLYASQNDHRNLSFVKDINVVGIKMTRNVSFLTEQTLPRYVYLKPFALSYCRFLEPSIQHNLKKIIKIQKSKISQKSVQYF